MQSKKQGHAKVTYLFIYLRGAIVVKVIAKKNTASVSGQELIATPCANVMIAKTTIPNI
jgi:hypothetical protein